MPTTARRRPADDYIADASFLDDSGAWSPDDEDAVPARSSAIQSGWEAALKNANDGAGGYPTDFKFTEDPQLVKFVVPEPIAVYSQHWIERQGKRSWVCLGDGCPLCAVGDRPGRKVAFSVVNMSAETPVVEVLTVSPKTMQILNRYHTDKVTGPLDRMYYSMSKTGTGTKTVFNILPVKPRDLEEDWGLDPASTESIVEGFEPFDDKVISFSTRQTLEEIAREINLRAPRD